MRSDDELRQMLNLAGDGYDLQPSGHLELRPGCCEFPTAGTAATRLVFIHDRHCRTCAQALAKRGDVHVVDLRVRV